MLLLVLHETRRGVELVTGEALGGHLLGVWHHGLVLGDSMVAVRLRVGRGLVVCYS